MPHLAQARVAILDMHQTLAHNALLHSPATQDDLPGGQTGQWRGH